MHRARLTAHRFSFPFIPPHHLSNLSPLHNIWILPKHATIPVSATLINQYTTPLHPAMNEGKSSEEKPVLDQETRRAINLALTNQNTILQLTDSGRSAQRKRKELKRGTYALGFIPRSTNWVNTERALREQFLAKTGAQSAQTQEQAEATTSSEPASSDPPISSDAEQQPESKSDETSEDQDKLTLGLKISPSWKPPRC